MQIPSGTKVTLGELHDDSPLLTHFVPSVSITIFVPEGHSSTQSLL